MTTSQSPKQEVSGNHNNGAHATDNGSRLRSRSKRPASIAPSPSPTVGIPTTNMDERKGFAGLPVHSVSGIAATAAQATSVYWTSIFLMVSLIFGGCCSNVFALEAIIKDRPSAGPLITFAQFILTALFMSPNFFSLSAGFRSFFLDRRSIPLRSWFIYTAFFVSVNLLNNWAFAYRISVPLHIILRSGGPVASMVVGYLYAGKRYSQGQILAVALLTFGVVTSALADAQVKGQSIHIGIHENSSMSSTFIGFAILALAMLLSAFQGIYADRLYETYGRSHWKEALFYSHTLSLPLFLPTFPQLLTQWRALNTSPSLLSQVTAMIGRPGVSNTLLSSGDEISPGESCAPIKSFYRLLVTLQGSKVFRPVLTDIPVQVFYLLLNALTQYWCIRGVHLLSAKSSSLTVTIILNIRKLVSLLLSIQLFGNALSHGVLVGAVLVFVGGAIYGFEGARLRSASPKRD
ncbi:UAA transporter family-domain-containing protein [Aspergillus cavernicola]|uniref:UAA transporter family-domain-containing protein n=1 Tax=Aspergillus cavernicola TaxID=176166 RepID=A0ABR4HWX4_9EURO